jgi:hypothetical protein
MIEFTNKIGNKGIGLKTPNLLKYARMYFNCDKLYFVEDCE